MVKTWKMMLCLAVAAATCFVCGIVSVIRPRTTMAYDYIDVTGTDNAIVSDFKMINGASVRFVAPTGIRFQSEMPITEYDKLMEEYDNVEIATLLIPTSGLHGNELTVDTANTLKISFTQKFIEDGKVAFKGVLTNIPSTAYTTELTAVSYVKADDDTTTYIQYASFDNGEKASVSRSIAYVSEIALADDEFVKTEDMYLFLTDMAFSNATIAGNISATADSTETNVAVELKTSYTKDGNALGDNVISYVEYASSKNGNIFTDADGKQYFYSASTGSYTVTSTAKINKNGKPNDVVAEKTISVSATAAQNALGNGEHIFSHNNYETDFFVKFLTNDDTATPYTLSYMHNGDTALDIMTINRDGKDYNYGTISLLHNDNMKNGGRYAEKGAKLDFSKGVYIKLIKYAKTNDQVVISLYTSQDGKTYTIYASAFYGGDDTFTGVSGMNATFNKIKLTASAPVFVSGFTATTGDTSEPKNTTLPKFNVLEVSLTASPDEIRVGENSTLTPSVTYGGDVIANGYEIAYEITSDNKDDASINNGVFTSNVAGVYTVQISVTYAEKTETATATVTVLDNELSATLNFTDTTVETEEETTADLSVVYNGEDVDTGYTVSYSVVSDNSANATVTNAGVFSATANGDYIVRATVSYGGLECYAEKKITVANKVNVEIDLSGTTSVARTNVGVFLYENVSVGGVATDEYDVVFTANGGTVATYDGKYYFYATSAGEYEITATVTINDVAYEKTTTITVSGSTAYTSIYSCDFNADYRESKGTIDSNVIIGKDGYYYGARNNAVDNALFFNDGYSVEDTYAIELYIKYIGTVSSDKTLFFSMFASKTFMGDGITLVRARGTTNASLTIAGAPQSGTKNFGDGAWLRIVRTTENGTHKFKVYVSEDKSTWTLWASADADDDDFELDFTGFCLYSQTPVMVKDFTVYEDASMVIDMTDTAGSAYVDETVELASVVTFAGDKLDGVDVIYSIVSGNGSIENGRLSANDTGDITVSATATYNGFTATTTKTITFNTALTATFTAESNSIDVNGNVKLTLSVNYHGNETSGYTVAYVISPNENASVSEGVFTANAVGTYTVTATITHTASKIELSEQVVISVGSAEPVIAGSISLSDTTDVSRTNVGVVIYADVTFTVDSVASDAYTVEYNATGGNIGTIDGKPYFVATSAGNYTITATLKYNGVAVENATASKTITVADGTALSAIYSCNSTGDLGSGSIGYSDIVIGREGCYNGRSGDINNKHVSYLDVYVDFGSYNPISNIEYTIFVKFLPEQVNNGDDIYFNLVFDADRHGTMTHTIMKINTNGEIQLAEVVNNVLTYQSCEENINFANGIYVKFSYNAVKKGAGTFKVEISDDNVSYRDCVSTSISGWGWVDYGLDGINIYANTPVIIGNYTVKNTSHF